MSVGAGCEYEVPGVVIDHEPSPSLLDLIAGNDKYIGSPAIAILPGGEYVASHDIFGDGSTQETSGVTKIFRSTDQGMTWTQTATLQDQFWSVLFEYEGAVYIMGPTASATDVRDLVIRRSDDAGATWTTPVDETSGLLMDSTPATTPHRPVVHDGRLWVAMSTRVISAPLGADLLRADSWTLSNAVPQDSTWLDGRFEFWSEGQIVPSPDVGVVLMPKVKGLPYTALLRAASPSTLTFDANNDFVELPGTEKKFGAAYDAVSGCFYVLSNPVLPAHKDDFFLQFKPEMIRNTAAVLLSKDLIHWDVKKIFLYSPNIHYEAFQYLNFEFDGDDLSVVSRTAFNVGANLPPRGHDSNLMTFHRIQDFRTLAPSHVLVVDAEVGGVLRYEETQHERAPLGAFPLGSSFAGEPLGDPVDLTQDQDGNVYIREQAGRILKFDAAGNFIDAVPSAPVPFQGSELFVDQPAAGDRSWIGADSSAWEEPTNWYYWGRPDTFEEIAIFGSAEVTNDTVTLDRSLQIKGLRFRNEWSYTLAGTGSLLIQAEVANGVILSERGQHTIQLPITLGSHADAHVAAGALMTLEGCVDLAGKHLSLSGEGLLTLDGDLVMQDGRLVVSAERPAVFGTSAGLTLDGTLELKLPNGVVPTLGDTFDLLDFTAPLGDSFDAVVLPGLPGGLDWDTSLLYTTGVVQVVSGT